MHMSKTRKEFEYMLLRAFDYGLTVGYGIEHTNLCEQEMEARKEFMKMRKFKYTLEELGFASSKEKEC